MNNKFTAIVRLILILVFTLKDVQSKPATAAVAVERFHQLGEDSKIDPTDNLHSIPVIVFPRSKRVLRDLLAQETRHNKNRGRQSYNYKSPSRKRQYQNHNRHSDQKHGKGGYHNSNSYNGNKGYSDYTTYNKANKDSYGDSDHKQFGHKDGGKSGGSKSGGNKYGGSGGHSTGGHGGSSGQYGGGNRGKYSSEYSDNSQDFLGAGGGY